MVLGPLLNVIIEDQPESASAAASPASVESR